jgi:SulP family sulfate permease
VLLATFLLTVFRDLTEAIVVGFALGSLLFIHRMSQDDGIETRAPLRRRGPGRRRQWRAPSL